MSVMCRVGGGGAEQRQINGDELVHGARFYIFPPTHTTKHPPLRGVLSPSSASCALWLGYSNKLPKLAISEDVAFCANWDMCE